MALAYNYSNVAVETTLSGSISNSATNITVAATTGFPTSTPYILALGYGAADEELVKVTAAAGTVLTVERGFGGTSAQSHSLGAKVRHVVNAQDLTDFRQHEADSTAVHGLTGTVVGTSDTQTLSNKTLTSPAISTPTVTGGGSLAGTFTGDPTLAGDVAFTGTPVLSSGATFTGALGATFEGDGTGSAAYTARVTGDAFPRLAIGADGTLTLGGGTAAGDTVLYRLDANVLATDDLLRVIRSLVDDDAISLRINGDTSSRFMVEASGKMFWGPGGSSTLDTILERTGSAALETNAHLTAAVETSSSFTAASGFTLNDANLRKTCGVASVTVYVSVTNSISTASNSPNITDTVMGTLPPGFRPTDDFEASWSTGLESGSAVIGADGVITLRTSDYNQTIESGSNLRVSATFIP